MVAKIKRIPARTDFQDESLTNVGSVALDEITSDSATSIGVTLGDDAGDDFKVDSTSLVVKGDTGKVGIGTAAPGATLGVDGDLHFQPTAITTSHITTAGSLDIRATNNLKIGTDGADSVRLGRTNTTGAKIHLRSGADTDLVVSNSKIGIGTETPSVTLDVVGTAAVSGDLGVDGTANLDNTDVDGTLVVDGSNISLDSTSTLNIDNSNTSNGITIGTATSGVPVSIGHSTSEVTVNDNLTVTGNLTVDGTTTTINSTTLTVDDKTIVVASGAADSAAADGAGISVDGASATILYDHTGTQWEMNKPLEVTGAITATGVLDVTDTTDSSDATGDTGALRCEGGASIAKKLFVGTDLDVDGTANLDAVDIDGAVQLDSTLTVGADDQGYDVILYGDTASANLTWDTSVDDLILNGAAGLVVPVGQLFLGDTAVTSTAAELNVLDGIASVDTDISSVSGSDDTLASAKAIKTYVDAQVTASDLDFQGDSGGALSIDLDSETLTIAGGTGITTTGGTNTVTAAIDAAQTGITSVVNASLEIGRDADNRIKFGTDNQIIFEVDGGDNVIFKTSGEIEATSLDISGDVDVDGTLEADNITVGGAQGSDGQVLTSTGSGVAWEDAAGGGGLTLDLNKTDDFTAAFDYFYEVDSSSSAITVTLPATGSGNEGKTIDIFCKVTTDYAVTITQNGSEKINYSTSDLIVSGTSNTNVTLVCAGDTGWFIR